MREQEVEDMKPLENIYLGLSLLSLQAILRFENIWEQMTPVANYRPANRIKNLEIHYKLCLMDTKIIYMVVY